MGVVWSRWARLRRFCAIWGVIIAATAPGRAGAAELFEPVRSQLTNDIAQLEATNTPTRGTERVLRTLRLTLTLVDTAVADERTLWRVTKLLNRRNYAAYEPGLQYAAQGLASELSKQVSNVTTLAFEVPASGAAAVAQQRAASLINAMARQAAATNVWRRAPVLYRARLAFFPAQAAALRAVPSPSDFQLRLRFARRYVSNDEGFRFPSSFSQLFLDSSWQKTAAAYRTATNLQLFISAYSLPGGSFRLSGGIQAAPGHYRFAMDGNAVLREYLFGTSTYWQTSVGSWYVFTNETQVWGVILAEGELALQGTFSAPIER